MVLKPIGSGLTLKAAFPATALSGPHLVAKSRPSHNPAKALGSPRKARYARATAVMQRKQTA